MSGSGMIQVGGIQKKITGAWVQVNGQYKKIDQIWVQADGQYKKSWSNNFPKPATLIYPNSITRGQTITWSTDDVIGADYEIQISYNSGSTWSASQFFNLNSGQITVTEDTTLNKIRLRLRVVAQTTHDKQSSWLEGTDRDLIPEKLANVTGLTYAQTIARGDKVRIYWNVADVNTTYNIRVVYNDGNNTVTDTVIYSSKVSELGQTYFDYTVSTETKWRYIQFRAFSQKTGYYDSNLAYGTTITLSGQKLGTVSTFTVPAPIRGQSLTLSWSAVSNAGKYQVEVFYNTSTDWTRIYWGENRSYTYTITSNTSIESVQFRVRATNTDYVEGNWKLSATQTIGLPPLKSSTWTATSTHNWRPNYGGQWDANDQYVIQGEWTSDGTTWGNYKGLAMFDYQDIRSKLSGKTISKVQVYFYRINTSHGYTSGQAINVYTHNYSSHPSGEPSLTHAYGPTSSFTRGEGKWVTVSNSVAERIRDGSAAGIALYNSSGANYLKMSTNVKLYVEYR